MRTCMFGLGQGVMPSKCPDRLRGQYYGLLRTLRTSSCKGHDTSLNDRPSHRNPFAFVES
eukprot:2373787-Amphidinium_carterae.1